MRQSQRSRRVSRQLEVERLEDRSLLSFYTFTKIADTHDGLSDFRDAPALNNAGTVAFLAKSTSPIMGTCLYTGNGGELIPVACEGLLGAQLDAFPSINGDGTVAFVSRSGQKEAVLTGSGGPLTTLYSTENALFFSFGSPALNNAGTVTFLAATPAESFPWIIFAGDGGPGTIIDRSDVFWFTQFGTYPSLNDAGTVAYTLWFRPVQPLQPFDSINLGDGQTTTSLYSTQDGFFSGLGNPVVNDAGRVAFFATLTVGGSGIFAGDGGPVATIATTGGIFSDFAPSPAMNKAGAVAFLARLTLGGRGIFTGPEPDADKVIATGDEVLGAAVTDLQLFRQGLNDAGQIAFFARLDDGTSGIYRADPGESSSHAAPARAPLQGPLRHVDTPVQWTIRMAAGNPLTWAGSKMLLQQVRETPVVELSPTQRPGDPSTCPTEQQVRDLVLIGRARQHSRLEPGLFREFDLDLPAFGPPFR